VAAAGARFDIAASSVPVDANVLLDIAMDDPDCRRDPLVPDGAALADRMGAARSASTALIDLDAGLDLGAIRQPALLDAVIAYRAGFLLLGAGR
jgi:hypothetical protein